jgi:hypothetical protein
MSVKPLIYEENIQWRTYIIIRHLIVAWKLDEIVEQAVDYTQGVEVYVMRALLINRAIINLLILLLEELEEPRPVMTPITFSPQTHSVIMRLVPWELSEPSLGKVPQRVRSMHSRVSGLPQRLATHRANIKGVILLRNAVGEVCWDHLFEFALLEEVYSDIGEDVVREANLGRLVKIEHVHLVVPRPWVQVGRVRVCTDKTRAVFLKAAH